MAPAALMLRSATRRFCAVSAARAVEPDARAPACSVPGELEVVVCIAKLDYLRPCGCVQPRDAESVRLPGGVSVASGAHHGQQLGWRWKVADRGGQVVVGSGFAALHGAADGPANGRQHAAEVERVSLADEASWLAELENA